METLISVSNITDKTIIIDCWNDVAHIRTVERNQRVILKILKNVIKLKIKTYLRRFL